MYKLYQFLLEESTQGTLLPNHRVLLEFGGFEIVFDLEFGFENVRREEEEYESGFEPLSQSILKKISLLKVQACFLASSEYLGYRPDIIDYIEPSSICSKLYECVGLINKIDPIAIDYYHLTQNDGYNEDNWGAAMCSLEPNYLFKIHLNSRNYSNVNFFKELLTRLKNTATPLPPKFYWIFYKRNKPIIDSAEVSILSTNTKARRIGYLKLLADFFSFNSKVSASKLNRKFEDYAIPFESELSRHSNTKGKIKRTKTGISAKPYLKLAEDLDWLSTVNNVQIQGKATKVFQILRKELQGEQNNNPFHISNLERFFFLELLISKDFLYLSCLIELIYTRGNTSYKEIKTSFQPLLLQRLAEFLDDIRVTKPRQYKKIKITYERISNWEEPDVYLEHVLMPRLNWLHDLQLIVLTDHLKIYLQPAGIRFFRNICYWNDINATRVINPLEFLNRFAIHMLHDTYEGSELKNDYDIDYIRNAINVQINASFEHFKTLAPNRITASQAFKYVKYKLYFTESMKLGHRFIENHLRENAKDQFIYKFQKQYGDGYIQKK